MKQGGDDSCNRNRICIRYVQKGLWSEENVAHQFESEEYKHSSGVITVTPQGLKRKQVSWGMGF